MKGLDEKKAVCKGFVQPGHNKIHTYGLQAIVRRLKEFYLQIVKNGSNKHALQ